MKYNVFIAAALLLAVTSSKAEDSTWPIVNYDFNGLNEIATNALPVPAFAEPMSPNANQLGTEWVAKGRPFYSNDLKAIDDKTKNVVTFTVAPGTRYTTGIDSSCEQLAGTTDCTRDNAIYMALKPSTFFSTDQDKIFFRPVPSTHEKALDISTITPTIRYLNFDIKFDSHYDLPRSGNTLHMQAYQGGVGPAMSLQVLPSVPGATTSPDKQDIYMTLKLFNTSDFNNYADRIPCAGIKFDRDKWYNIVVKLSPTFRKDAYGNELGEIGIYVNHNLTCYYRGNWGYDPSVPRKDRNGNVLNPQPIISNKFEIDLGVYRGRSMYYDGVYFDNIRYAPTYDTVTSGESRVP